MNFLETAVEADGSDIYVNEGSFRLKVTAEQKKMIQSKPVEFPMDIEMVIMCSENLKNAIRGFMETNRRFIN